MTRSTLGGRVRGVLWRAGLLTAAALAGAGASGLSAVTDLEAEGDSAWGALPMKDPQTGTVVGHYCTGVHCYDSETSGKYSYCCVL